MISHCLNCEIYLADLAQKEQTKVLSKLVEKLKIAENEIAELEKTIQWYKCRDFAILHPELYEKAKENHILKPYCVY